MKLVFTLEAERQAEESDLWCRANRPKAPGLFAKKLTEAKTFIVRTPKLGKVHTLVDGQEMRRVLLPKTGHHVYYTVDMALITIHAVWGAPRSGGPRLRG